MPVRLAPSPSRVSVKIAPGELLDKIGILEFEAERFDDSVKVGHVRAELASLIEARDGSIFIQDGAEDLTGELKAVNESLWRIEDEFRECERAGDFGPRFVEL